MFLGIPDPDPFLILWNLWLQKKDSQAKNYFLLLFFVDVGIQDIDPGSVIRDPWSEIRDPRSVIRDGKKVNPVSQSFSLDKEQIILILRT